MNGWALGGLAVVGAMAFVAGGYVIALAATDPEGRGLGDVETYVALAGVVLGALSVLAAAILTVIRIFT